MDKKFSLSLSKIIIIFLLLSYLSVTFTLYKTEPLKKITGFYQSTGFPDNVYQSSFHYEEEGTYYLKLNDKTLENGGFEKYKDNIYICYDKFGKKRLITLLNNGFYFFDYDNDRVVEMEKMSDIPTNFQWLDMDKRKETYI